MKEQEKDKIIEKEIVEEETGDVEE